MFKLKKALLLMTVLFLVFVIVSCGGGTKSCNPCVDEDGNGICDVCNKEMSKEEIKDVPLVEEGEPTFQVVLGKDTSTAVRQAVTSTMKSEIRQAYDTVIDTFIEGSELDEEIDIEVLVGNVTSRGEQYSFDGHTLGKEGYAIKIVGSKIIIGGGSDESIIKMIEDFTEFLVSKKDLSDVFMTNKDTVLEIQDDYKIDSLKVNGNDMKGYTLAADLTRNYYEEVATTVRDTIYEKAGYWFDIVDVENATEKSLVIKHAPGVMGEESFKVSANGSQLIIACGFDNMLESTVLQFVAQHITSARGDVDFKNTVFTKDISVVYYDDFGAKGDGETDDFFAIRDAHMFANESGQTVKASRNPAGKVYYIRETSTNPASNSSFVRIPIRTNTDWQGVKFLIDDRNISTFKVTKDTDPASKVPGYDAFTHEHNYKMGKYHIFEILPDEEHEGFNFTDKRVLDAMVADGINPDTKKINFKIDGWDGGLMLVPYNSEHAVFRRRGAYSTLQSTGDDMHEIIVIDKDGNVSEETPITFEYTNIDYIVVYKLDPKTGITVGNATLETLESRVQNKRFDTLTGANLFSTEYIRRGIQVTRSYTVVENVKHEVVYGYTLKERANGFESSNYEGTFYAQNANHVTFRNCELHGRQMYDNHSSYDFGAKLVNKIVLENCIQTNFWVTVDPEVGVMNEHREYVDGAYTSMSTVKVYDEHGKLKNVQLCWGIGGTNYCKNMEFIGSQLSRFDAHAGLCNGKIINSSVNCMALIGYGDMVVENSNWYQEDTTTAMIALRSDYGFQWSGNITVKDTRAYVFDITDKAPTFNIVNHAYTNFYYGYLTVFPNIILDNLDIYSLKMQAPVEKGYTVNLFQFTEEAKKMHINGDSGQEAIFTYYDADKDGYIDEPLFDVNFDGRINDLDRIDFDGNGEIGNTSLVYSDYAHLDVKDLNKGIKHTECKKNLNTIKPPEFIKIINNDGVDGAGGYTFFVVNTAGQGISDGGWYRDENAPDTLGGFFGGTKFIYGEGENDYVIGTAGDETVGDTFFFLKGYYKK